MDFGFNYDQTYIRKSDSPDFFVFAKPKQLKDLSFFTPLKESKRYFRREGEEMEVKEKLKELQID